MFSWCALYVPPKMQLVQCPNASGLYLTRVLLAGTNCVTDAAACAVSERLGLLLDLGSPSGTNCATDAAARIVSKRFGLLLDPSFPGRHKLCRRCCSWCSLKLDEINFSMPQESTAAGASQAPRPVLEKSKQKITRLDGRRASMSRYNTVPTTIHANK